jgi:predicted amidohydrolase
VLPEVFLWRGPRAQERNAAEPIPGPATQQLAKLARQLNIYLLAGSILEDSGAAGACSSQSPSPTLRGRAGEGTPFSSSSDDRQVIGTPSKIPVAQSPSPSPSPTLRGRAGEGTCDRVFNTSLLFDPHGEIIARYRKVHLFDIDIPGHVTIRESDSRAAGDAAVTVPTELGVIGMTVCYDLRFPELYRKLTWAGAEIIAVPSAFTFPTGAAHWEILLRARAIENQVYVIAPDQIGSSPSGVVDFGNSMIVDPWGKPLARAADREMVILAEINRDYQQKVRRELPCLEHVKFR